MDARLSSLEALSIRLEERIAGDREERKLWREEVNRRLHEANNALARADVREKLFLSKEEYLTRHLEIQVRVDTAAKELATQQTRIIERFDLRAGNHDDRLKALELLKAEVYGRILGGFAILVILQVVLKIFWK